MSSRSRKKGKKEKRPPTPPPAPESPPSSDDFVFGADFKAHPLGIDIVKDARLAEMVIEAETVEVMRAAGIRPQIIYAYQKTGRIVTEQNRHNLTDDELAEWTDAVAEYKRGAKGPTRGS